MTVRAYFPSELAICARRRCAFRERASSRGWVHVSVAEIIQLFANGNVYMLESSDSAVASSFMWLLSLLCLKNICLNWRLLTYAACAPHCHIGNSWRKALKSKGRKNVHARRRDGKMKGKSETEDVVIAKCPLLFSIWMISLSWHNPLRICLFPHSSSRDFTLNALVSVTASQSGHCFTSEGRARRAESMKSIFRLDPIRSACCMAYLRFNYTTH